MRAITDHIVNGLNEAIKILALDAPGPGGANHVYAMLLQKPGEDVASFLISGDEIVRTEVLEGYIIAHLATGEIVIFDRPGNTDRNRSIVATGSAGSTIIRFQNGPIGEVGFNGLTGEALLAVQIDRMRGFQHARKRVPLPAHVDQATLTATEVIALTEGQGDFDFNSHGKYASRENACSLTHTEESLMWLQKRTRDRVARGVEGTHKV